MKIFRVNYKTKNFNKHLKIEQNPWFHLFPSILIFTDYTEECRWNKINVIELAWFYWEIHINIEGWIDLNDDIF
jgi:hypothetical protein